MKDKDINKIVWTRAEKGKGLDLCIIYYDEDGNELIRYKDPTPDSLRGSRSWRHNNPGNLKNGPHAKRYGAIGSASYSAPNSDKPAYFAIFPDYETGKSALANLLYRKDYVRVTLHDLPRKYLGIEAGQPDTEAVLSYRSDIKKMTGFDMNRIIESLDPEEFEKLLNALERHEGWHPGDEAFDELHKIVSVRFKRGTASEFLICGLKTEQKWVIKTNAIALAQNGILWVVLVQGKHGIFLRPYPGQPTFRQLIC